MTKETRDCQSAERGSKGPSLRSRLRRPRSPARASAAGSGNSEMHSEDASIRHGELSMSESFWTGEKVTRLAVLWEQGLPAAEIARDLGTTRNAVIGKAHRRKLSARPSPIGRGQAGGRPARPRKRKERRDVPPPAMAVPAPEPTPRLKAILARPEDWAPATARRCQWPIGEPGTREFRFCETAVEGSQSYCLCHQAAAYVRRRTHDHADAA